MNERENILVETVKKSTLTAQELLDYKKLEVKRPYFIPCSIEEKGEDISFIYDFNGLKISQLIEDEDNISQYQFLINLARLKDMLHFFKFEMIPENVYYDENFLPYIKFRDIYAQGEEFDEADFLFYYKCFIGGILHEKYSINDIIDCGLEVLGKNKYLDMISKCKTSDEIVDKLREKRLFLESYRKQNEIRVNKNSYVRKNILCIMVIAILLGTVIYTGYYTFFTKPKMLSVISANQAYINKDYVGTIDSLKNIEISSMDANTKYILAVAYSRSETFKKEEIQNILTKLTSDVDERFLEYWIYVGRLDLSAAQDIAISLSDDKLLIYAYMKEAYIVESDTTLTGAEKKERLTALENEIENLGEKYESVAETTSETTAETTPETAPETIIESTE